uniref:Uncharacterized protein n=1 Tax=viral metagenome TaxID=1070528 RepID=A0A6M3LAQ4_9ZZZZ
MKTAIYIEDGNLQVVLTPEDQFERNILGTLNTKGILIARITDGSFYQCVGGYVRHSTDDRSLILTAFVEKETANANQ